MTTVLYILLAIVILLIMVIIHEFGHYIAGKILKFKINEFSVGFGPKLFSKTKKNGEVFSLRLIPLGGFCAFEGETGVEEETDKKDEPFADYSSAASQNNTVSSQSAGAVSTDDVSFPEGGASAREGTQEPSRAFVDEKPWKRIIVLLAGGVFNLLSAVLFSFLFILIVGYATPRVEIVYTSPSGEAYCALREGDEILKVNGKKINVMHSFEDYVANAKLGDTVTVTILRDGVRADVDLAVQTVAPADGTAAYTGFGIRTTRDYRNGSVGSAFAYCVPFTAKMSWTILGSFFDLICGKIALTNLTGPVGTVGMMASVASANWRNIFVLLPLIASNLGLFNLLPIPALDGSKVIFTLVEWIRGKPINRKVENMIHTVGLLALFAFVIVVDIVGMILR